MWCLLLQLLWLTKLKRFTVLNEEAVVFREKAHIVIGCIGRSEWLGYAQLWRLIVDREACCRSRLIMRVAPVFTTVGIYK